MTRPARWFSPALPLVLLPLAVAGAVLAQSPEPATSTAQPRGAGAAASPAPVTSALAFQVEQGRTLYRTKGCYQCHGFVGQGAILGVGPALVPPRLEDAAFKAYVRKPGGQMPPYSAKILPEPELTAIALYVRSLPRARDAGAIPLLAPYVVAARAGTSERRTAQPPPSRPAPSGTGQAGASPGVRPAQRSATALPPAARLAFASPAAPFADGAAIYRQHCASCHGAALEGGVGPALRGPAFKSSASQIAALVRDPPPTMPALYPSPLSERQVLAVSTFVQSQAGPARPAR